MMSSNKDPTGHEYFKANGTRTVKSTRSYDQTFEGFFAVPPVRSFQFFRMIYTWDIQIDSVSTSTSWSHCISIGIKHIGSYTNQGKLHGLGRVNTGNIYARGDIITVQLNPTVKSIAFYKTFRSNKQLVHCAQYKTLNTNYLLVKLSSSDDIPSSVTIQNFTITPYDESVLEPQIKLPMLDFFQHLGNNIIAKDHATTITNKEKTGGTSYGAFVIDITKSSNIYRWTIEINGKGGSLAIGIEQADALSSLNADISSNLDSACYVYTHDRSCYALTVCRRSLIGIRKNDIVTLELDAQKSSLLCYKHKQGVCSYECNNIRPDNYRLAVYLQGSKQYGTSSITIKDFTIVGDYTDECVASVTQMVGSKSDDEPLMEGKSNDNDIDRVKPSNDNDVDPGDLVSQLLERIQHQNAEIQKLMDEQHLTSKLKEENNTLKNENATQNNRLMEMEKEMDELKWRLNQIREENSRLQEEKKENVMMIRNLKDEVQLLKAKVIDVTRFMEWQAEDVLNWLLSIEDGLYRKYEQTLRTAITDSEVCGKDLITMDIVDLQHFGVSKFADRKILIEHIKRLNQTKVQNIQMNENYQEEYEGLAAPTAYI
eukprot:439690_1